MAAPKTIRGLMGLLPNSAIEEVGDRRELVIYTGLSVGTYDYEADEWTDTPRGRLVPMPENLD
jgi:hypothetical protein